MKKARKTAEPRYVAHSYEVGFTASNGRAGYVSLHAGTFNVRQLADGFWVDGGLKLAKLGEERYFIMPHMISYVRKDYMEERT